MRLFKKSVSALISVVLLIVVVVAIVNVIMGFGKSFTNNSINKVTEFKKENINQGSLFVKKAVNDTLLIESINIPKDIEIVSYRIISDDLSSYLYSKKELSENLILTNGQISKLNILCFPSSNFDVELYTVDNTYFRLNVIVDNFIGETCSITDDDCPTGYISVPGNDDYDTGFGFCIMKYEAKIDINSDGVAEPYCYENIFNIEWEVTHSPRTYIDFHNFWKIYDEGRCEIEDSYDIISTPEGGPLIGLSQNLAKSLCNSLGSNYHLVNNNEWMTVARNLEQNPVNWTGGFVGDGKVKSGNVYPPLFDSEGRAVSYFIQDLDVGSDRNELAKLVLSNGSEIWDFVGNVAEFVDESYLESDSGNLNSINNHDSTRAFFDDWDYGVDGLESPDGKNTKCAAWYEFKNLSSYGKYRYDDLGPLNKNFSSREGMGQILISPGRSLIIFSSDAFWYNSNQNSSQHIFIRGGNVVSSYKAGLYTLNTKYNEYYGINQSDFTGFRCVYDPFN